MKPAVIATPTLPMHVEDRRFFKLFARLMPYGGMLSDEELRCMHTASQSAVVLGHALLKREVIALGWRHRLWLPMFQFHLPAWEPSPHVTEVVADLFPVLQGFDLVEWFLTPNAWLRDHRPVDMLQREPQQVRHAAQVDRFLITF